MASLFIHPPARALTPPPKTQFDPELSLTIQDKAELKVAEFHNSLLLLARSRDEEKCSREKVRAIPDPKMRVFVSYQEEMQPIDVAEGKTVTDVKSLVKDAFGIRKSQAARGGVETANTILCLSYAGAELEDAWVLSDIGVHPGSSLHAFLREEEQPTLHIYCVHNRDTIQILQKFKPTEMLVSEIRSIASRKCGLPVGTFRLVTEDERKEMYDVNTLDKYDVNLGDTVSLETWDGWSDFINLASRGFSTHALAKINSDELVARYQMKVALYIAAHYGHVDLAVVLLKQGIRSDEPIGEHPYRQWCSQFTKHIDSHKCPVHVAAEIGQFGIVRTFVHNNICCVMAKDGNGLRPLNLSLRNKRKSCASFLLTKQWSRVNFDNTSIPLSLFAKMKTWSVRAKDKAMMIHGQEKSTIKKRNLIEGPLVGQGIYLDGFSDCIMTSKSRPAGLVDIFRCSGEPTHREYLRDDPEYYFKNVMNARQRVVRQSRNSRVTVRGDRLNTKTPDDSAISPDDTIKLPSLVEKSRRISSTTVSSEHGKDERLPLIGRKTVDSIREETDSPHSVFEQNDAQLKSRKKKKKETHPELLLMQAKTAEATIPLPIHSAETIPKPVFHRGNLNSDLALGTMSQYEEYRGMKAKDYAVKCLSIASTFKEKPWLQQVRLALTLTNKSVKKNVKRRRNTSSTEMSESVQESTTEE